MSPKERRNNPEYSARRKLRPWRDIIPGMERDHNLFSADHSQQLGLPGSSEGSDPRVFVDPLTSTLRHSTDYHYHQDAQVLNFLTGITEQVILDKRKRREREEHEKTRPSVAIIKDYPSSYQLLRLLKTHDVYADILPDGIEPVKEYRKAVEPFSQLFADKGFGLQALEDLTALGALDDLFANLVLRQQSNSLTSFKSGISMSVAFASTRVDDNRYIGTSEQNREIDESIAISEDKEDLRRIQAGRGATRRFYLGDIDRIESRRIIEGTPVIIIGAGPAGLMAAHGMIALGFSPRDITVIDKSGEYGGIWKRPNVVNGSKNNPFKFAFDGVYLDAAPGPGRTVATFLHEVEEDNYGVKVPKPVRGVVTSVIPGDLDHQVTYRTKEGEKTISAPIVINAIGNGIPMDPNREGVMTTDTPDQAGSRWQQIITPKQAERYRDKTIILVGLGNSTIEMLEQIQEYNKQEFNIDYRVITHYPVQAVENPIAPVVVDGKLYQVYRNITTPNLTKVEGDLPKAEAAYEQALHDGKIVSDVTHWHSENKTFTATRKDGSQQSFDYEQQFTLIGYTQYAETLRAMGMHVTDETLGEIAYDYDGEIQKRPGATGRNRVYAGYFGLGAILKTQDNPNAVVMPGIMHRMYDLLFTTAIRATEYKIRKREAVFTNPPLDQSALVDVGLGSDDLNGNSEVVLFENKRRRSDLVDV